MSQQPIQLPLPGFEAARAQWQDEYGQQLGGDKTRYNRSGWKYSPFTHPRIGAANSICRIWASPASFR